MESRATPEGAVWGASALVDLVASALALRLAVRVNSAQRGDWSFSSVAWGLDSDLGLLSAVGSAAGAGAGAGSAAGAAAGSAAGAGAGAAGGSAAGAAGGSAAGAGAGGKRIEAAIFLVESLIESWNGSKEGFGLVGDRTSRMAISQRPLIS